MSFLGTFIKQAVITDEDVAAGLAGLGRQGITPEEVEGLASRHRELAAESAKNYPYAGAGVGGALGALGGILLGASQKTPSWLGKATGAGLGALAGGGLGALGGLGGKKSRTEKARTLGQTLGEIAREGRVPSDLPKGVSPEALVPYARGIQEQTASPLSPTEYSTIRSALAQQLGPQAQATGTFIDPEDPATGALFAAGGLEEARDKANMLADLYERGYGQLAAKIYERL